MNSFVTDYNSNTSKNVILPKCSILVVLRYTHEEEEESDHEDWTSTVKNEPAKPGRYSKNGPARSDSYSEKSGQ